MSETARLVYMANQIAAAFRLRPVEAAIVATSEHIQRFWDPRMRRLIVAHARGGGQGLDEVARLAVDRLAANGEPPPPGAG